MEKIAFDARGNQKLRKFLTGGIAGGTSVGLGLALMNYIKDLHTETKTDTSGDDNILYVDVPTAPQVPGAPRRKQATVSGGLGATAAVLGALGSAAAVRKLFQEFKKKELQQQLDKAQVAYTGKVVAEADDMNKKSSAGVSMRPGDIATSTPLAMVLLTTLASGALTYKGLNKYFPAAKRPTSMEPKRVVIRRKKPEPSVYEEEGGEDQTKKVAYYLDSHLPECDIADDALEFLVKIALHNPTQHSDLKDLVYAVANGRHAEICDHGMNYGMESAFDIVKNASCKDINPARLSLAVSHCIKSSFLRPIVEMLAYAEFNDMAPISVKAAADMTDNTREILVKIAAVLGAGFRNEFWTPCFDEYFTVKNSSMLNSDMLEDLLGDSLSFDPGADENASQIPLTMETESDLSESQRPQDQINEQAKSRLRVQEQQVEDEDQIDMLLSGMSGGEDQWAENHTQVM
jgi:hypothetical protein